MSLPMASGMNLATRSLRSQEEASRAMISIILRRMERTCAVLAYAVRLICPWRFLVKAMANMRSV